MKKINAVFCFFLISFLFFGCQKKTDNFMQEQSEPEVLPVSDSGDEKPIAVPIVEPTAPVEIVTPETIVPVEVVTPEAETDDAVDKTPADAETISVEDNIPEITETDGEIEAVEVPAVPVFPDEPKYSVAELTEMAYVLDYLSDFFEGKEYAFFEEPQNVGSRYIYFAAHYVPRSPENAFDQFVAFQIKDGAVIPRFIVKDGKFIDDEGNVLRDFTDTYPLHGFNFYLQTKSMSVATYFVYDGSIGGADTFGIYWYEERETYDSMRQDDPNWQPGM